MQTKLRLNIAGFIFIDYANKFEVAIKDIMEWIDQGKIRIIKTIYSCNFEQIPHGLDMVLNGENVGSLVTQVC